VKNGKNFLPKMQIKKRKVIVGSFDVQKSGLFYTIMEMF